MMVLLSEYKEILDITGNTEDEFVELAQYEVEEKVKTFLGRELESTNYVEIYDGTGTNQLIPENFPINSVTTLEFYEGILNGAESWITQVLGTDYDRLVIPKHKNSIMIDGIVFPKGNQNVRVTYNAGYSTIPNDIQQACKKLMLLYYGEVKKTKTIGKASVSEGSTFTKTTSYDLNAEERILKSIEKYMDVNV